MPEQIDKPSSVFMKLRLAELSDEAAIVRLIEQSVLRLTEPHYTFEQRRQSVGSLFGVDRQIINDRTYYVLERGAEIVAAGGWSFRRTVFGGDAVRNRDDSQADPQIEAAHVRAFYVHPDYPRQGIGTHLLATSEAAALRHGFSAFALSATLTGEPFYARHGYLSGERFDYLLPSGLPFPLVNMHKNAASF